MEDKLARANRYNGPPLPPRNSATSPLITPPPPSYADIDNKSPYSGFALAENDPRSSSTQSLVPAGSQRHGQRTLLLVYIHGFMGNETSFQSFPAHVHNLVTITLAESHVVHTKLYPRYQSRRTIDQVSEDFSNWLEPHESPDTDVILLSHSMGGLVAAEIVLLPPHPPPSGQAFRHRILGFINFDVPFLGMHPGVISAGLGSIFKPAPDKPGAALLTEEGGGDLTSPSTTTVGSQDHSINATGSGRVNTLFASPTDPNYNPAFQNDVILPVRKGWQSAWHFVNKHSDNLRQATKQLVKSHMEFGGAMTDYSGLKSRYSKVRALDDEDEAVRKRVLNRRTPPPRVRFVNYYTASTGRPKKPKSPSPSRPTTPGSENSRQSLDVEDPHVGSASRNLRSRSRSPAISIEDLRDGQTVRKEVFEMPDEHDKDDDMTHLHGDPIFDYESEPEPEKKTSQNSDYKSESDKESDTESLQPLTTETSIADTTVDTILGPHFHVQMPNLPPIPHAPMEPSTLDLTPYPDKEARKIAQKEHDRKVKAYKQAIKDRDSALKDREKLEAKLRKNAAKEILKQRNADDKTREEKSKGKEKKSKGKEKEKMKENENENEAPETPATSSVLSPSTTNTLSPTTTMNTTTTTKSSQEEKPEKPKKDRKFCVLPPKNNAGERDPTWVRVFMKDMDEVSAHCGLFFLGPTYERLVGDVSADIEEWVKDDMTARLIAEETR